MGTGKMLAPGREDVSRRTNRLSDLQPFTTPLVLQYALAALMVAAATMVAIGFDRHVAIPNLSLIYVIPVVVSAVFFGLWPSMLCSVLGALAYNFFFTEPRLTLEVDDPANIWAIGLLFGVGCIASAVASAASRRADHLVEVRRLQVELRGFARAITGTSTVDEALAKAVEVLKTIFNRPVVTTLFSKDMAPRIKTNGELALSPIEMEAALSAAQSGQFVKSDIYPFDASRFDFWPASIDEDITVVVGIAFDPASRPEDADLVIEIVSSVLALALARSNRINVG